MPKISNITYYKDLSIKENAEKNGVTEAGMRYYCKTNPKVDRRRERSEALIEKARKTIEENKDTILHEDGTPIWEEVAKKSGVSITTLRRHRDCIIGNSKFSKLTTIDSNIMKSFGIDDSYFYSNEDIELKGLVLLNNRPYEINSFRDIVILGKKYSSKIKELSSDFESMPVVYFGVKQDFMPRIYKIGSSNSLKKRENTLATSWPGYYTYAHIECKTRQEAFELETKLHEMFEKTKISNEWFFISDEDFDKIKNEYNLIIDIDNN